ncbi:aspartyl-tRNA(Asn)/glutamyl-tRNA(Gln) amidotransferase subunit A [Chitinophaga terrae (ex Kim and Jung 2007)]|uniref:Asp-tRNA(Asn)/Glu-tRNA(Gln) amidotransferase subunit GatA n=1 Tax=Chitinophaga terrae (ex Kim and Jung 2007) TaxID=408074 RepID=UPI00277FD342|nr:Asp-tRNA(Asn)/Glu-tRNA(Gln) amidotransferase subunit GatA [Chitinophaga terrae (ex Kim and Jung 2007)]MDQ0107929.1 aspartyl-tRNA(Asn)/glutamyl-tRNA(Gln) amidotransferase subunit A [Chitinophaga terrae (ex Kim and Jung 2007)]
MSELSSIATFHEALYAGRTSCVAEVRTFLDRIAKLKHLNAFLEVYEEEALNKAQELDNRLAKGGKLGALAGVVVGIKDVICYKGHNVSAASRMLEGFNSIFSATAIERLLAEDAIIIGNLNCDEFAMGSTNENSAYGPTLNALDTTRVPGGSSGGSAVAVQANLCHVSLGSDTGGSVRQPADFCGIIGLKPTYGRISRHGLIAYASSFDQIGIFGRDIADVAAVLQVIAGPDEFDSTASQHPVPDYLANLALENNKSLKFAYLRDAQYHDGLDAEMRGAYIDFFEKLVDNGHTVTGHSFEYIDHIVPAYYVLTTAEASSNLSRYDGVKFGHRTREQNLDLTDFYKKSRSEGFGIEVKRRILLGTFVLSAGYYDAYYTKAQQVRRLVADKLNEILEEYDAILMPTVPSTAFKLGEKTDDPIAMYLADIYTVLANLVGVPAISVPLQKHSNGMPYGVQIITKKFSEESLLRIARLLMAKEQVTVV